MAELEKTYEPQQVERRWYQFWTKHGYFQASANRSGTPYTIVIPPPNVTGSLHIGHALNNTIQDILIRWRRMQGRNALWVPGTDHAGIATQNVVERQLTTEGTTRETLGRAAFIQRVWEWKAQSGGTIIEQLKRLGASCDWSRLRFTMDEGLSKAVRDVFVGLYEDGLIYRGERLINWCPRCLTALSDIEVQHEDTSGQLYHIRYPLADRSSESLTVATTRPETMLGDAAVAVHPEDDRYNRLIGQFVSLPLTNRKIPIVGDSILVNREFGSGAVKITPAHDFNDFEAGERHRLPRLGILDLHARLDPQKLQEAEVEEGVRARINSLSVLKARPLIVEALTQQGYLTTTETHKMALGKCYRCKTVVEPLLSPQWFVKIKPLAEPAIAAVEDGRIRFVPETWTNNYLGWMRDIKDWCISRQIWWGHQIPAWYCRGCNRSLLVQTGPEGTWLIPPEAKPLVAKTAPARCPDCGNTDFLQDPDVLDTWFSSALWPFSTLGWPEDSPDLRTFYPTSTLVTGLDILFFWVARMIMMGLKFTGQVPFRDVYIHALVRDAEGQKMSKSKGNVIDPLSVMDTYGTDAFRFTLASMASPGRDIKLAVERIEGYRNFANKIWNAARFLLMNLDGPRKAATPSTRSFPDRWILSRLNRTIGLVNAALEQYRFDQACSHLYHFIWHEYCDWYLELIKPVLQDKAGPQAASTRQTLIESFECLLRLLHPIMPFISEEIWQALPRGAEEGQSITIRSYPTMQPHWDDKDAEATFGTLEQFVTTVRTGRVLLNYPPGKMLTVYGAVKDQGEGTALTAVHSHLEALSRSHVQVRPIDAWPRAQVLRLVTGGITAGLLVEGEVDLQKALDRIRKQTDEGLAEAKRVEGKLGSPEFTGKAPAEVVAEHKHRLQRLREELALLGSSEAQLREMADGGRSS